MVATAESYVNSHVGRGIFPSQPVCVLTLIQAHALSLSTDLSAGAYGAIFEVLLQASLARNSRRVPAEFLQAVLAEIAIQMLTSGLREISEAEFLALVNLFNTSRLTEFSTDHVREALLDARLLRLRDGKFVFRYPHMYYLSCAKALQIQKQDPSLRTQADGAIDQLIGTIDRDESANILVCYLYFSKDLETVQKAIVATNAVFSEETTADPLTLDFGLGSAWPENILEDVNLDEKRLRRFRESQDRAEQAQEEIHKSAETEDVASTAILNKYFKCVKSMHLIGQVVRSFPALLPGAVKIQAIESVVGVALRALNQYATVMRMMKDELRLSIVSYLAMSRGLHSVVEARDRADRFMTGLAVGAGHGLLRRAAVALSASHIFPALRAVGTGKLGNGFRLVQLSISMDHQRGAIDVDQLIRDTESLRKSGYVSLLFQMFVNDFLMTYRIPEGPRDRLVAEFGLNGKKKPPSLGAGHR